MRHLAVVLVGILVVLSYRPAHADSPATSYTVVRDVLYASPTGSVSVQEASSVVAAFVTNPHNWGSASGPVRVEYNGAGAPSEAGDVSAVIQNAIATWDAIPLTTFSFTYGGTTTATAGSCADQINVDGENTITFAPLEGLVLAVTCTISPTSGPTTNLVEFDMQISNDAGLWSSLSATPATMFDLPSAVLHELGHAAGLGHSDSLGAVMSPVLDPGEQRRTLTDDDIAGLRAAYPSTTARGDSQSAGTAERPMFMPFHLAAAMITSN
ncbi:MAG: matrixin family metalloprotease [Tepidiformaceae bacterium]